MSLINQIIEDNLNFISTGQASISSLQNIVDGDAYSSWCNARSSGVQVGEFFRITGESQVRVMRHVPPRDESFTFKITLGIGVFTYELPATTWISGVIEWGDGTRTTGLTGALGAQMHTYASDNQDYYITIWNLCTQFSVPFGSTTERTKLTEILSWGSPTPGSTNLFQIHAQTFKNCTNLVFDSLISSTAPELTANISEAFSGCTALTSENVSAWDFSVVTNASQLFYGCANLLCNGVLSWDTSNVTDFSGMFDGCATQNLNFTLSATWDTSSATTMANMFNNCTSFVGDGIDTFVIPLVADLSDFATNTAFTNANYDALLAAWAAQSPSLQNNVVFDMNATTTYLEIAARAVLTGTHSWIITDGGIAVIPSIFEITTSAPSELVTLATANYTAVNIDWGDGNQTLSYTSASAPTHIYVSANTYAVTLTGGFYGADNYAYNNGTGKTQITSVVQFGETCRYAAGAFYGCSNLQTISTTDVPVFATTGSAAFFFTSCALLQDHDFSAWNMSGQTTTFRMFYQCTSLTSTASNFSGWNLSSITTFAQMFSGCSAFKADLSTWTLPLSGVDGSQMFLNTAYTGADIAAWGWNFSIFTNASSMFANCAALTTLPASNFSSATTVSALFNGCTALAPATVTLNISAATALSSLFNGCSLFNPTSMTITLNTTSTYSASFMFNNCTSFVGNDISTLNLSKCTNLSNAFTNTALTRANYDAALSAWAYTTPLSYWLAENNGTDSVGSNNATIFTGTYVTGKLGSYAFNMTGGQMFSAPDTGLPSGGAARSWSFWLYVNSAVTFANIMGVGGPNPTNALLMQTVGTASQVRITEWATVKLTTAAGFLSTGVWTHLALVFEGNGERMLLYKNGVMNTEALGVTLNSSTGTVQLNRSTGGNNLDAAVDDMAIFNYALSPAQVAYLYNGGTGRSAITPSLQSSVTLSIVPATYTNVSSRGVLTGTYSWTITDGGLYTPHFGSTIYGLRKIKQTYGGSAVRIRRSSDNAESDIGFASNGDFDASTFTTFVGGSNGHVTTWYDQSGSARNVAQTTLTRQPILTLSAMGTNNRATVAFSNSSQSFLINTAQATQFYTGGFSMLYAIVKYTSDSAMFCDCGNDSTTNRRQNQLSSTQYLTGRDGGGGSVTKTGLSAGTDSICVGIHNGASSSARVNKVAGTTGSVSTTVNTSLTSFTVGGRYSFDVAGFTGEISELVVFDNSTYFTNVTSMENEASTYFGI